jgi:CMP-N-acetylneuraminic acid synthetase
MNKTNVLVIIPARGGSKEIPRKNLRNLNGMPLISYSIKTALASKFSPVVYVTSEDSEILFSAKLFGAQVHRRDESLSNDSVTLDPVVYDCYIAATEEEQRDFEIIVTMQPTSPLLSVKSLDEAIGKILNEANMDTLIASRSNTHLTWSLENDSYVPNYKKRVNRQELTPVFAETGAFLMCRNRVIKSETRIGRNVDLFVLSNDEAIDIDSYEDWSLCEYYLKRRHILFVVTGNREVGLGHVYNTLQIANDILQHNVSFLVDKDSEMAFDKIQQKNYPVFLQQRDNIVEDIIRLKPHLVVNDILDTSEDYVSSLHKEGFKVINFEDLGQGGLRADLVVNAIYPGKSVQQNHYFGSRYFLLRDEFVYCDLKKNQKLVQKVLLSFGGVDSNNYTYKVLDSIYSVCNHNNIEITVLAGFGYNQYDSLSQFDKVDIIRDTQDVASYVLEADVVFTSAGRTTYEIASIGTPAIVLAQNERELTHFFASSDRGFLNLGFGVNVSTGEIREAFLEVAFSFETRERMSNLMKKEDLRSGRNCVLELIEGILNEKSPETGKIRK